MIPRPSDEQVATPSGQEEAGGVVVDRAHATRRRSNAMARIARASPMS
jgi:hypothetical protein